MTEKVFVPGKVVRAVITRPQPKPELVRNENPQVLLVERPNWSGQASEDWQLPGGRIISLELQAEVARIIGDELGIEIRQDNSPEYIGGYENGDWTSWLYLCQLLENPGPLRVDLDRNQGVRWFDTNGKRLILEREQDDVLVEKYRIAFDHHKMISDALKMIREKN